MTLRFAPARQPALSPIARALSRPDVGRAANDDLTAAGPTFGEDATLHQALRHFAAHGLGAAQAAKCEAERAIAAGDQAAYERWLGVCRALDRRLAGQLARRHAPLLGEAVTPQACPTR